MSHIELFYDIVSPYSYLASTQLEALEERTGKTVVLRPFLLGAVMKAAGSSPPASVAARAAFMAHDLRRWTEHYGVPFKFSSRFPSLTIKTQRALLAADALGGPAAIRALTHAFFKAYWVEDRDVTDPSEIASLARACGIDESALMAKMEEPAIKELLKANGDEAAARGAFGAPTFYYGDSMFFGNDRIEHLALTVTGKLSG